MSCLKHQVLRVENVLLLVSVIGFFSILRPGLDYGVCIKAPCNAQGITRGERHQENIAIDTGNESACLMSCTDSGYSLQL